jgi:hypothetical protein
MGASLTLQGLCAAAFRTAFFLAVARKLSRSSRKRKKSRLLVKERAPPSEEITNSSSYAGLTD